MLDQNLAGGNGGGRFVIGGKGRREGGAIDAGVDISCTGDFEFVEAFDRAHAGDNFLRDFARGLAQFFRQLESKGQSIFAELYFRRLFDDDGGEFEAVGAAQKVAHRIG